MIHLSFPLPAFALFHFPFNRKVMLFPSPFNGEVGRGMGLLRAIHETSRRA